MRDWRSSRETTIENKQFPDKQTEISRSSWIRQRFKGNWTNSKRSFIIFGYTVPLKYNFKTAENFLEALKTCSRKASLTFFRTQKNGIYIGK